MYKTEKPFIQYNLINSVMCPIFLKKQNQLIGKYHSSRFLNVLTLNGTKKPF